MQKWLVCSLIRAKIRALTPFFEQSSSLSLLWLACNCRAAGFLCLMLRMRFFLVSAVCEPVFSTPQEGRWMPLIYSSGRGETGPTGDYWKQMDAPRRTQWGHRAERRDIALLSFWLCFPALPHGMGRKTFHIFLNSSILVSFPPSLHQYFPPPVRMLPMSRRLLGNWQRKHGGGKWS